MGGVVLPGVGRAVCFALRHRVLRFLGERLAEVVLRVDPELRARRGGHDDEAAQACGLLDGEARAEHTTPG